MKNILFISGSLRAKSLNTALLQAFAKELENKANVHWADINLPLFNEELEAEFPAGAQTLKDQILAADSIVISTPEYNRAMSGALKNAIDWASRPYGQSAWSQKKILVTATSLGGIAGALAVYQVKQSLLHLGANVLGQPEFMVGGAFQKFDENGNLTDETTQKHVAEAVEIILQ